MKHLLPVLSSLIVLQLLLGKGGTGGGAGGSGGRGGGAGGGGGRGGGTVARQLTTSERIAALNSLGRQSDEINALNRRAETARTAFERTYGQRSGGTGSTTTNAAYSRYQQLTGQLREVYNRSVQFSRENGITQLPTPSALQQR